MDKENKFICLNGKGIFSSAKGQIEKLFTVHREFSYTAFLVQEEEPNEIFGSGLNISESWSLSGQLEDGRGIFAEQLMIANTGGTDGYTEFTPLASVVIGSRNASPLLEAQYPLVGMFDGEFSIEDSGWTIEVLKTNINPSNAKRKLPLEIDT